MATGTNGIATRNDVISGRSVTLTDAPSTVTDVSNWCPPCSYWDEQTNVYVNNHENYSNKQLVKYSDVLVADDLTITFSVYNFIGENTFTNLSIPYTFSISSSQSSNTASIVSTTAPGLLTSVALSPKKKDYVSGNVALGSSTNNTVNKSKFYAKLYHNGLQCSSSSSLSVSSGSLTGNTVLGSSTSALNSGDYFTLILTSVPSGFNFGNLGTIIPNVTFTSIYSASYNSVYFKYSDTNIISLINTFAKFQALTYNSGCVDIRSRRLFLGNFNWDESSDITGTNVEWQPGYYYVLNNKILYVFEVSDTNASQLNAGVNVTLSPTATITLTS